VVLFFEKGKATKNVWFYQLNPGRNLGKTNPLNEKDLEEFVGLQKTFAESENSWTVDLKDVDQSTFDLSVKNPNTPEADPLRQPQEILEEMRKLDKEADEVLDKIEHLIV
jgi:type I restriction enzyme M protein